MTERLIGGQEDLRIVDDLLRTALDRIRHD